MTPYFRTDALSKRAHLKLEDCLTALINRRVAKYRRTSASDTGGFVGKLGKCRHVGPQRHLAQYLSRTEVSGLKLSNGPSTDSL